MASTEKVERTNAGDDSNALENGVAHTPPKKSMLTSIGLIAACSLGMVINTANNTATSIALPTVGRDFGLPEAELQWLVSAYALSSGCLLVLFGRLADLYGRKLMFLGGSLWLAVFSLGCAFANDGITLEILRGFQGVGAAASIPASMGILAHAFPPGTMREIAFATFAAGAPLGGSIGLCLGAVMTQLTAKTWRSNFYLLAGLTVLSMILGYFTIDPDHPSEEVDKRVDWIGGALVTVGLVLIVYVLSDGEIAEKGWATSYIVALLVIGVLFVALFILWQWYLERQQNAPNAVRSWWTPPPLMKLSLWSRGHGRFAAMMVIVLLQWCSFLAWNFWTQLYYQDYERLTPILTMVRFLPMFVTGILCNVVVAAVVAHVPLVYILASGTLITACASIFFAVIDPAKPYWNFGFPSAIFSVFGADFVFAAGTIFIARIVQPHEQSLAGGLFNTMLQIGTALGITVTTIIYNRVKAKQEGQPNGDLHAYQAAEWGAFAFGVLGTVIVLIFMRGVGIVGGKMEPMDEDDKQHETTTLQQSVNEAEVKETKEVEVKR